MKKTGREKRKRKNEYEEPLFDLDSISSGLGATKD